LSPLRQLDHSRDVASQHRAANEAPADVLRLDLHGVRWNLEQLVVTGRSDQNQGAPSTYRVESLSLRTRVSDDLEGEVCSSPVGKTADELDNVSAGRIDDRRAASRHGSFAFGRDKVHADDLTRTGEPSTLDYRLAYAAATNNYYSVAWLNIRGVHHCSDTGDNSAPH
jgi:hypothetical protein